MLHELKHLMRCQRVQVHVKLNTRSTLVAASDSLLRLARPVLVLRRPLTQNLGFFLRYQLADTREN